MINVIDISITPNRGDCFSIRGIAREIGVINQLPVTAPEIKEVAATISDEKESRCDRLKAAHVIWVV